jgi:hypothetical protein
MVNLLRLKVVKVAGFYRPYNNFWLMVIRESGNAVESDFIYVNHITYFKNFVTLIPLKVTSFIK